MRIYVAGPMTGIPQFNFPLFDEVAEALREAGEDVHNPAEMDDPSTRKEAMASKDGVLVGGMCNGHTWGDFLSRDVKIVADDTDGICVLPGWHKSKGARLEVFVAMQQDKPIYWWSVACKCKFGPMCYDEVLEAIEIGMGEWA